MGRIKSTLIKRTAKSLMKEENNFTDKFDNNKALLGRSMPSIRLRNRIAGYITRLKMNAQKKVHKVSEKLAENEDSYAA